ncbi:hypothetical protein KAU86_02620 [bacterium]|nr:hypothetical protein [bacterium]MCK4436820.1 hypothetical protein [bacterium]
MVTGTHGRAGGDHSEGYNLCIPSAIAINGHDEDGIWLGATEWWTVRRSK